MLNLPTNLLLWQEPKQENYDTIALAGAGIGILKTRQLLSGDNVNEKQ